MIRKDELYYKNFSEAKSILGGMYKCLMFKCLSFSSKDIKRLTHQ